jgi:hypothetical protein
MPMRREDRKLVGRPARIEMDDGKVLQCRIANVSSGGALLIVFECEWLPKRFRLFDVFSSTGRHVELIWTEGNKVGVRFIEPHVDPWKKGQVVFGKRVADRD